ncbi:hypothetical protein EEB14_57020 [Rhodococcus sp. WS4]|nr:hypothetical protein EEB14_57020 [Rhodococcus sp. WS4]
MRTRELGEVKIVDANVLLYAVDLDAPPSGRDPMGPTPRCPSPNRSDSTGSSSPCLVRIAAIPSAYRTPLTVEQALDAA